MEAIATTPANRTITKYRVEERTWDEIHADLRRQLPDHLIKTLREKGQPDYIEWQTAVKILDCYAPGWSKRITALVQGEGMLHVAVEITVPCQDCNVVQSSTGSAFTTYVDAKVFKENRAMYPTRFDGFGTPAVNAEQQAFKRAAALLGVAFELSDK